jgi:hypothetical protein
MDQTAAERGTAGFEEIPGMKARTGSGSAVAEPDRPDEC